MKPTVKCKHGKTPSRLAVLAALAFAACDFVPRDPASPENPGGGGMAVDIEVRTAALAKSAAVPRPTDSATILVAAPDMTPHLFWFGGTNLKFSLTDLTPGPSRHFTVQLFRQGRLLYAGEAETTLYADRKNAVFLHCLPRFSRVAASVHVPVDFPRTVARGELRLRGGGDTLIAPMNRRGEFLLFQLEEVPGDRDYAASLFLWDSAGALLATAAKDTLRVPMGQSVSLEMPIVTTFSQLQIGLTMADPMQTSLAFSFPAGRRVPAVFGEAVFSELFPAPAYEDSSSQGEWLELFNRTSDTLDFSGCGVVRDGGGTTSKQFTFVAGTLLPPGHALVAGHKYAPKTDVLLTSFTLPNSLSRMELSCQSGVLKLDSLTYSMSASDSTVIPVRDGKVSELRPAGIIQRADPASWCLVPSHPNPGEGRPTPGTLEDGCGG